MAPRQTTKPPVEQRTQPPQQGPPPGGALPETSAAIAAGTLIGIGKGAAVSAAAIAEFVRAILRGFDSFFTKRDQEEALLLFGTLRRQFPDKPEVDLHRLVSDEMAREVEFRKRMRARLKRDLPKALRHPDPQRRKEQVDKILARERRYIDMREQAMIERSIGQAELEGLRITSPEGALWILGNTRQHTPLCVLMAGKWWPHSVLRILAPPLHVGCACELLGRDEAISQGLMRETDELPDEQDAMVRARRAIRRGAELGEKLGEAAIEEIEEADIPGVPESARGTVGRLRIPKGFRYGGRFLPRRGGSFGPGVERDLLRGIVPKTVTRRGRSGRWRKLGGQAVFVPEDRRFERVISGVTYTSPPQSDIVYADGKALPEGDAPPQALDALVRAKRLSVAEQRKKIAKALRRKNPQVPPVEEGDVGIVTLDALRAEGFILRGRSRQKGIDFYRLQRESSLLEVGVDEEGDVVGVKWNPTAPPEETGALPLVRPPRDFAEFTDDMRAFTDVLGKRYGTTPDLGHIRTDPALNDHAGMHYYDGDISLGPDIEPAIDMAGARRRDGEPLTDSQLREVFGSYQTATHELLHATAPIDSPHYAGEGKVMEEALTEELAHIVMAEWLRRTKQEDVLRWATANPSDSRVRGYYSAYRDNLAALLNAGRVSPDEREQFLIDLKFKTHPGQRMRKLAERLVEADPEHWAEIDPENPLHYEDTDRVVTLAEVKPGEAFRHKDRARWGLFSTDGKVIDDVRAPASIQGRLLVRPFGAPDSPTFDPLNFKWADVRDWPPDTPVVMQKLRTKLSKEDQIATADADVRAWLASTEWSDATISHLPPILVPDLTEYIGQLEPVTVEERDSPAYGQEINVGAGIKLRANVLGPDPVNAWVRGIERDENGSTVFTVETVPGTGRGHFGQMLRVLSTDIERVIGRGNTQERGQFKGTWVKAGDTIRFDNRLDGKLSEAEVVRFHPEGWIEARTTKQSLNPGQVVLLTPDRVGDTFEVVPKAKAKPKPKAPRERVPVPVPAAAQAVPGAHQRPGAESEMGRWLDTPLGYKSLDGRFELVKVAPGLNVLYVDGQEFETFQWQAEARRTVAWIRAAEALRNGQAVPPELERGVVWQVPLSAVINIATDAMERGGVAGRRWVTPEGHIDLPEVQAANRAMSDFASEAYSWGAGEDRHATVVASNWLEVEGGPHLKATVRPALSHITVRHETNDAIILHEVAHLITETYESDESHTPEFARKLRDLYEHFISPEAAETFWNLVGLRVEGQPAPGEEIIRHGPPEPDWSEARTDDRVVLDAIKAAVEQVPERSTHGHTGANAFFVVRGEVYPWNEYGKIPAADRIAAVPVHSHSADAYSFPEEQWPERSKQALNAGDIHGWLKEVQKGRQAPRQVLIYSDGTAEILSLTDETDPRLFKLGMKRLKDMLHSSHEEASAAWRERGVGRDELDRERLRAWSVEHGVSYVEGLRWATPSEAAILRGRHPSKSVRATAAKGTPGEPPLERLDWKKVEHGLNLPTYEAAGLRGRYKIGQGNKLWRIELEGTGHVGSATKLVGAKALAVEIDRNAWTRDRREMLDDYRLGKITQSEFLGGNTLDFSAERWQRIRADLTRIREEIEGTDMASTDRRSMISGTLMDEQGKRFAAGRDGVGQAVPGRAEGQPVPGDLPYDAEMKVAVEQDSLRLRGQSAGPVSMPPRAWDSGDPYEFNKEAWLPGERAFFEYHCYESHDSADAQLWYRSHQQVEVLRRGDDEDYGGTILERGEAGVPNVYRVRFADGHEGTVFEDELFTSAEGYYRPDPPAPRESGQAGQATPGDKLRSEHVTPQLAKLTVSVPDNPELYGKPEWDATGYGREYGQLIRGTPISPDDPMIPDTLYHVTTNLPAVLADGKLRASGQGGLGGDKQDRIVSLTANPEYAGRIERDIRAFASIYQEVGPAPELVEQAEPTGYDYSERYTAESLAARREWRDRLVNLLGDFSEAETGWRYQPEAPGPGYSFGEWVSGFLSARASERAAGVMDPVFLSMNESMPLIDPENVGTVSVARENLKTGALITDFDLSRGGGLDEVRVYGDVEVTEPVVWPSEVVPGVRVRPERPTPWDKFKMAQPEQLEKLKEAVRALIEEKHGWGHITPGEYERAIANIDGFQGPEQFYLLSLLSGQPYNIFWWKDEFLEDAGIELPDPATAPLPPEFRGNPFIGSIPKGYSYQRQEQGYVLLHAEDLPTGRLLTRSVYETLDELGAAYQSARAGQAAPGVSRPPQRGASALVRTRVPRTPAEASDLIVRERERADVEEIRAAMPKIRSLGSGETVYVGGLSVYRIPDDNSAWPNGSLSVTAPFAPSKPSGGVHYFDISGPDVDFDALEERLIEYRQTPEWREANARKLRLQFQEGMPKLRKDAAVWAAVEDAVRQNATVPRFDMLEQAFGPDIVLVLDSERGRLTERYVGDFLTTGMRHKDWGFSALNAAWFRTGIEMYERDVAADKAPHIQVNIRDKPHEPGQTLNATAATLRHEYGHGVWDSLTPEEQQEFVDKLPSQEDIAGALSSYASDLAMKYLPEYENRYKGREHGRATETFAEFVAISTNPDFDPGNYPPWVGELTRWLDERVIGERVGPYVPGQIAMEEPLARGYPGYAPPGEGQAAPGDIQTYREGEIPILTRWHASRPSGSAVKTGDTFLLRNDSGDGQPKPMVAEDDAEMDGYGFATLPYLGYRDPETPEETARGQELLAEYERSEEQMRRYLERAGVSDELYRPKTQSEGLSTAMRVWRGSFANSLNFRSHIEGGGMAPAFTEDRWNWVYAELIADALASAPSFGRESWRITPTAAPEVGVRLNLPVTAVAFSRRDAEDYKVTFQFGMAPGVDRATLYHFPADTHGLTFAWPDRREGIASGSFEVTEVRDEDTPQGPVRVVELAAVGAAEMPERRPPPGEGQAAPGEVARSWEDFPFDEVTGQRPNERDVAPERTPEGDFVLYHGTSEAGAEMIRAQGVRPDDLGVVGISTTPGRAQTFAAMKRGPVLRIVVSRDWLAGQSVKREIGGSGRDQFLIEPGRPREAILRLHAQAEAARIAAADRSGRRYPHTAELSGEGAVARFVGGNEEARRSKHGAFLSTATPEELAAAHYRLFMSEDNSVMFGISGSGDLGYVYNGSPVIGAGRSAILHAVREGAQTLDAFDGVLPLLYAEYGFREVARTRFVDEYAPEGWNYDRDDRPDVVHMAFAPSRDDVVERYVDYEQGKRLAHDFAEWNGIPRSALLSVEPHDFEGQAAPGGAITYRGPHEAPDAEPGTSMDNLSPAIFPEDIYSYDAARLYGDGSEDYPDQPAIDLIQRARGRPDMMVTVYRAVPIGREALIARYEKEKAAWLRRNKWLPDTDTGGRSDSAYFDFIYEEIPRLQALPEEPKTEINPGDWVTPTRAYAKLHGEGNIPGHYEIISKRVRAGDLYNEGAIHEWSWVPQGKAVPGDDPYKLPGGIYIVEPVPGPDVGIHSIGGFGPSETIMDQYPSTRQEGHFGTGYYFVSSADKFTSGGEYAAPTRRIVGISLLGKRLVVPKDKEQAWKLNDLLGEINYLGFLDAGDTGVEDDDFSYVKSDLGARHLADVVKELDEILPMSPLVVDSPRSWHFTEAMRAIEQMRADRADDRMWRPLASTRFMRRLGFDGVDVRHIPELDNTEYGSVVYADAPAPPRKTVASFAENLVLPKSGKGRQFADRVIGHIDRLLAMPEMPKAEVRFHSGKNQGGSYANRSHKIRASVNLKPNPPWPTDPNMTIAHELAHFIDHEGFRDPGGERYMESWRPQWTQADKSAWSATALAEAEATFAGVEGPGPLEDWWNAIKASPEAEALSTDVSFWDVETHKYLLRPQELFARSFAQWLALRSGDETLMGELRDWQNIPDTYERQINRWDGSKITRQASVPNNVRYRQWSDGNFQPIAEALDRAFAEIGWLRVSRQEALPGLERAGKAVPGRAAGELPLYEEYERERRRFYKEHFAKGIYDPDDNVSLGDHDVRRMVKAEVVAKLKARLADNPDFRALVPEWRESTIGAEADQGTYLWAIDTALPMGGVVTYGDGNYKPEFDATPIQTLPPDTPVRVLWDRSTNRPAPYGGFSRAAVDRGRLIELGPDDLESLTVSALVGQWADSAWDNDAFSIMLQRAVAEEFGLREAFDVRKEAQRDYLERSGADPRMALDSAETHYEQLGPGLRAFVRAMYEQTQDELRQGGIDNVTVFRGTGQPGKIANGPQYRALDLQPASSFSAEYRTALSFAWTSTRYNRDIEPTVAVLSVPRERILSTARTGFGALHESEVVVLGGDTEGWVVTRIPGARATVPPLRWASAARDVSQWQAERSERIPQATQETWEWIRESRRGRLVVVQRSAVQPGGRVGSPWGWGEMQPDGQVRYDEDGRVNEPDLFVITPVVDLKPEVRERVEREVLAGQAAPGEPLALDVNGEEDWIKVAGQALPGDVPRYEVEIPDVPADSPLAAFKVSYSEIGGGSGMPQVSHYLTVDTREGERVGLVHWMRQDADGVPVDGIAIAENWRGRGLAVALLEEMHRFTGQPLIHGGFSTPEGIRLGVTMSALHPEWNKLAVDAEDGRTVFWNPGDRIDPRSWTFSPLNYKYAVPGEGDLDARMAERVRREVDAALGEAARLRAAGQAAPGEGADDLLDGDGLVGRDIRVFSPPQGGKAVPGDTADVEAEIARMDAEWNALRQPYKDRGITVYRGIRIKMPDEWDWGIADVKDPAEFDQRQRFSIESNFLLDFKHLGIHWTTDRHVADLKAAVTDSQVESGQGTGYMNTYGLVLTAQVLPEDVVQPNTPEFFYYAHEAGVVGPLSLEREATIRPGSRIRVLDGEATLPTGEKLKTPNADDAIWEVNHLWVKPYAPTVDLADSRSPKGGYIKKPAVYLRFGDLPDGASANYIEGGQEAGVSVFAAWHDPATGKYVIPSGSEQYLQSINELAGARPVYVVSGKEMAESGADGEPLLAVGSVRVEQTLSLDDLVSESDPGLTLSGEELSPEETPDWHDTEGVEVAEPGQAAPGGGVEVVSERSGVPEVDKLIEDFLREPLGDWINDDDTVAALRDPARSAGVCQQITEQFVKFAKARGFDAYATDTDLDELGYKPRGKPKGEVLDDEGNIVPGFYQEHTVAEVYLPGEHFPIIIDFSATQYGYDEHPKVMAAAPGEVARRVVDATPEQQQEVEAVLTKLPIWAAPSATIKFVDRPTLPEGAHPLGHVLTDTLAHQMRGGNIEVVRSRWAQVDAERRRKTIAHEIGHQVYDDLPRDMWRATAVQEMQRHFAGTGEVYYREDPREAFAEAFARRHLNGESFGDIADEVLDGQHRGQAAPGEFIDPDKIAVETKLGQVTFTSAGDQIGREYHATYWAKLADGTTVGRVDVAYLDDEAAIRMIEVPERYRRQGVGSALIRRVRNESAGRLTVFGDVVTPEGQAFALAVLAGDEPDTRWAGDKLGAAKAARREMEKRSKLVYDANLSATATNRDGQIVVGPKFYELTPEGQRTTLAHEIGHNYDDQLLGPDWVTRTAPGYDPATFNAWVWDEEAWKDAEGVPLNGPGAKAGERIADAVAAILLGDKEAIDRWPAIRRVAADVGMVTPEMKGKAVPGIPPAPKPGTVRLYHGTTRTALGGETVQSRSIRDLASMVEDDFGLPRGSVFDHEWFAFERDRANERLVWTTGDARVAHSYASQGGESLQGALRTVWRIQRGADSPFPHDGLPEWERFREDYLRRKGIEPVVLALDVPVEKIPVPRDLVTVTPEEWRQMMADQDMPGDYSLPEVRSEWIVGEVPTGKAVPGIPPEGWHVSPRWTRESIRKEGINAGYGTDLAADHGYDREGSGAYFFAEKADAEWYAEYMAHQDPVEPFDVWHVVVPEGARPSKDHGLSSADEEDSSWFMSEGFDSPELVGEYRPGSGWTREGKAAPGDLTKATELDTLDSEVAPTKALNKVVAPGWEKVRIAYVKVGDVVDLDNQGLARIVWLPPGGDPSNYGDPVTDYDGRTFPDWLSYRKKNFASGQHQVTKVEVESVRTYAQTGRAGRVYVLTFDNGRRIRETPQRKLVVAKGKAAPGDALKPSDVYKLKRDLAEFQAKVYDQPAVHTQDLDALEAARAKVEAAEAAVGGKVFRATATKIPELEKRIAQINKRADKIGVPHVELVKTGETEMVERRRIRPEFRAEYEAGLGPFGPDAFETWHEQFEYVIVQGETPRVAGFEFVATLEHEENEAGESLTIVRRVPRFDGDHIDLSDYRHAKPEHCDHCGLLRHRKDTYVVRNAETDELKQVGRTCLKDFTGAHDPEKFAAYAEYLTDFMDDIGYAEDDDDGEPRGEKFYPLDTYLGYVAMSIRKGGWVSRKNAAEYGGESTSDDAFSAMNEGTPDRPGPYPEPEDFALAKAALEWARSDEFEAEMNAAMERNPDNDYLWNLRVSVQRDYVNQRKFGLVASLISAYQRHEQKEVERKARVEAQKDRGFVGEIGKRQNFTLTLTRQIDIEDRYNGGTKPLYIFVDADGNECKWFASNPPERPGERDPRGSSAYGLNVGETYTFKATVKSHDDHPQYGKSTVITRAKLEAIHYTPEQAQELAQEQIAAFDAHVEDIDRSIAANEEQVADLTARQAAGESVSPTHYLNRREELRREREEAVAARDAIRKKLAKIASGEAEVAAPPVKEEKEETPAQAEKRRTKRLAKVEKDIDDLRQKWTLTDPKRDWDDSRERMEKRIAKLEAEEATIRDALGMAPREPRGPMRPYAAWMEYLPLDDAERAALREEVADKIEFWEELWAGADSDKRRAAFQQAEYGNWASVRSGRRPGSYDTLTPEQIEATRLDAIALSFVLMEHPEDEDGKPSPPVDLGERRLGLGDPLAEKARAMLRERGIKDSDTSLVLIGSANGPDRGWIEMRSPSGKRMALVVLSVDGDPVDVMEDGKASPPDEARPEPSPATDVTVTSSGVRYGTPEVSVEPVQMEDVVTGKTYLVDGFISDGDPTSVANTLGYVYASGILVKKDGTLGNVRAQHISPVGGIPQAVKDAMADAVRRHVEGKPSPPDSGQAAVDYSQSLPIVREEVPADFLTEYKFSGSPVRYAAYGDPYETTHPYFKPYPGMKGFVDVYVDTYGGKQWAEIAFVNTEQHFRRQGIARALIQRVYDDFPEAYVKWGKLMDDAAEKLRDEFRSKYPDRTK